MGHAPSLAMSKTDRVYKVVRLGDTEWFNVASVCASSTEEIRGPYSTTVLANAESFAAAMNAEAGHTPSDVQAILHHHLATKMRGR